MVFSIPLCLWSTFVDLSPLYGESFRVFPHGKNMQAFRLMLTFSFETKIISFIFLHLTRRSDLDLDLYVISQILQDHAGLQIACEYCFITKKIVFFSC